jgi:predicted ATPase
VPAYRPFSLVVSQQKAHSSEIVKETKFITLKKKIMIQELIEIAKKIQSMTDAECEERMKVFKSWYHNEIPMDFFDHMEAHMLVMRMTKLE